MKIDDNRQDIRPALRLAALLGLAAILGLAGILGAARSSDHAPGPALEKLDRVLQHAVMQPADSGRGVSETSTIAGDPLAGASGLSGATGSFGAISST